MLLEDFNYFFLLRFLDVLPLGGAAGRLIRCVPAELSFAVVSSEAIWIVGGLGAPEILRDSFAPMEA